MSNQPSLFFVPPIKPDAPFVPVYLRSRLAEAMFWFGIFKERGIPDPATVAPHVTVYKTLGRLRAGGDRKRGV